MSCVQAYATRVYEAPIKEGVELGGVDVDKIGIEGSSVANGEATKTHGQKLAMRQ